MDFNIGEVLVMVGFVDYWNVENFKIDGNVNIIISNRQVGFFVKLYVYFFVFIKGYGFWLLVFDIKMFFGNYKFMNWDKGFEGVGIVRKGLGRFRNLFLVYIL